MKYTTFFLSALFFLIASCKDETKQRWAENQKATQKNAIIYKNISKSWIFYSPPSTNSEKNTATWTEFRQFLDELASKPDKRLIDYQKKTIELSKKAKNLNTTIPYLFQKPQIKSRIQVLITKVRLLELYIHLSTIPDKKVVVLISEINTALLSLQRQMDKIIEKGKIPVEDGETDMLQMLSSARPIPSAPKPNVQ